MKKVISIIFLILIIPLMADSQERHHRHRHHRPPAAVEVTPEELALIQLLRSAAAVVRVERIAVRDGNASQEFFGYWWGELYFGYADPNYYPETVTPQPYNLFIVFDQIPIPQGMTITRAWLEFSEVLQCQSATIDIYASTSPEPKSLEEFNALTLTAPYRWVNVGWSDLTGVPGSYLPRSETVDFAPIIQEIIDGPGWNGTVVLVFKGVLPGCVFGMYSTSTDVVPPVGTVETYKPKLVIEVQP